MRAFCGSLLAVHNRRVASQIGRLPPPAYHLPPHPEYRTHLAISLTVARLPYMRSPTR